MDFDQTMVVVLAIILAAGHLAVAALMVLLSSRAASGKLARNQWAGIRTPSTMRSDQAWVRGHAAAAKLSPLFLTNALAAIVLVLYGSLRAWPASSIMGWSISFFASFAALAVYAGVVAGRAAKSAEGESE
ncbi:SdpI family protein [[Mycobacterium] wendilense]|uniref:SdpI family protein n=1 Tax=[Mycobacterium] wendilense TaxID=3064284 RepID=A0ABM9ME18_9MYCO|nr:SdpI family protein [Mycolicibacterium sp. MU0050]CAJ1582889.1 SdpI family protein [Mycolicibacterium sp. MU0050]